MISIVIGFVGSIVTTDNVLHVQVCDWCNNRHVQVCDWYNNRHVHICDWMKSYPGVLLK